jgi:hypothetical protein
MRFLANNFELGDWKTAKMVRPERIELPTPWFVAMYSIQLSYGRIAAQNGVVEL